MEKWGRGICFLATRSDKGFKETKTAKAMEEVQQHRDPVARRAVMFSAFRCLRGKRKGIGTLRTLWLRGE